MPQSPLVLTFPQDRARDIAQAALGRPEGVLVRFYFKNFPSEEVCKKAAKSLQSNFTSMKAKERNIVKRIEGRDDPFIRGPFDGLGAFLVKTGDSYDVRIAPATAAYGDVDVLDGATGEPVPEFTEEYGRWAALSARVDKAPKEEPPPLTDEETAFFWSYNRTGAEFLWKWSYPPGVEPTPDAQAL